MPENNPINLLTPADPMYPANLSLLNGRETPQPLQTIGALNILHHPLTALFCSVRCPAELILETYDLARELRETGVTVIGGFHSPIEKDCLDILLRGRQPVILCPGKSLDKMRVPGKWKPYIDAGRLLLLSPFDPREKHITIKRAQTRNLFAAALATEIYIPHAAPKSKTMALFEKALTWNKTIYTFDHPSNREMLALGAHVILIRK